MNFERQELFAKLAKAGIHLPGVEGFYSDMAMDAQTSLVSASNSGIPAYLANYIDPNLIEIVTAPNKAAKILGELRFYTIFKY